MIKLSKKQRRSLRHMTNRSRGPAAPKRRAQRKLLMSALEKHQRKVNGWKIIY